MIIMIKMMIIIIIMIITIIINKWGFNIYINDNNNNVCFLWKNPWSLWMIHDQGPGRWSSRWKIVQGQWCLRPIPRCLSQVVSWIRGKLDRNLKITCQHVGKTRFYSLFKLTCGKKWKKWLHRAIIPFPSLFFFLGVVPLSFGGKRNTCFFRSHWVERWTSQDGRPGSQMNIRNQQMGPGISYVARSR